MVHPHIDTASQRPATGMDAGARKLIIQVIAEILNAVNAQGYPPAIIIRWFFENRYGDYHDYMSAVESVWGRPTQFRLQQAVDEAQVEAQFASTSMRYAQVGEQAAQLALLIHMPEPDFRLAIETALRKLDWLDGAAPRISEICRNRGIPWRLDPAEGFEWTGDQVIEQEVMAPALSILNDPLFAFGVATEFGQALVELKLGTPQARKQVLMEAAASVESAMKVVLDQKAVRYDRGRDAAQKLFEHLRDNGVVAPDTEKMLLACATPRNKRAGHGAGAVAHDVRQHEAEAFVAAAATAIVFLGNLL